MWLFAAFPDRVLVVDGDVLATGEWAEQRFAELLGAEEHPTAARRAAALEELKSDLAGMVQNYCAATLVLKSGIPMNANTAYAALVEESLQLPVAERPSEEALRAMSRDASTIFRTSCALWVKREIYDKAVVSPDEMKLFYSANLSTFVVPEERSFALLALPRSPENDAAIARAVARLLQGEPFRAVESSLGSTVERAVLDLLATRDAVRGVGAGLSPDGKLAAAVLAPDYAVAVFLAAYRPERVLTFEESAPTIERTMRDLLARKMVNAAIAEEVAKHDITMDLGDTENDL